MVYHYSSNGGVPATPHKHGPLAQLVEHLTLNQGVVGSRPTWITICGRLVKRLRHRPFTAVSGVRVPYRSPPPWALSSAGRASALQAECRRFDPVSAHQKTTKDFATCGVFFLLLFVLICDFPLFILSEDKSKEATLFSFPQLLFKNS